MSWHRSSVGIVCGPCPGPAGVDRPRCLEGSLPCTRPLSYATPATPLDRAWELHKAWPASRLVVVDDAGHFGGSTGQQFTAAIDAMVGQLHPAQSHPRAPDRRLGAEESRI